jgi:ribosome recycling factor
MINDIKKSAEQKMQKALEVLKNNLGKVRTGRAHAGLLDQVMVEYYGNLVPISQVGSVGLADARTITVQVWEKPMLAKVEKAIRDSDLGLNPANSGDMIRVSRPNMSRHDQEDFTWDDRVSMHWRADSPVVLLS